MKERFGGGRIGSAIAAVTVDDSVKTSTRVWRQGAIGEQKVARVLDGLAGAELIALHDRKLPKSRANFDHLVVTPSGVWVIDAKRYIGKRWQIV
ncbi:MAG: NERD domain-containing protein [Actinobacteria bacterium]|nr:NERD domain-containing protein [Actinomycetota bacterium]